MILVDEIVGQPRAVGQLRRMLATGKVPHALLFVGPPGVGKATAARALAAALNCDSRPGEGCATCAPCAKIAAGLHPDLVVVRPGGAGNQIAIDGIRELAVRLGFPPHEGRARVVLVEDADRLNVQAANAFLKTLEEPPARTYFVLVSSAPERLLVTILSRCQRVRFAPLPTAAVAEILSAGGLDADAARAAAAVSGGSIARAQELADGEVLARRRERTRALVRAAHEGTFRAATAAAAEVAGVKDDLAPTLELLAHWYRDAAAVAAGAPPELLVHADELDLLRAEAASAGGARGCGQRAAAVLEAHASVAAYANAQLALERMILELRAVRADR